mgnify:FL=1
MSSVSEIANISLQPQGGYIPKRSLYISYLSEGNESLKELKDIDPFVLKECVLHLLEFYITHDKNKAFFVSLEGAKKIDSKEKKDVYSLAKEYLSCIDKSIDEDSIISACKLSYFDKMIYSSNYDTENQDWLKYNPSEEVIEGIQIILDRIIGAQNNIGEITLINGQFGKAYNKNVSEGTIDICTKTTGCILDLTLRDVEDCTPQETLKMELYKILMEKSENSLYDDVEDICIYNPIHQVMITLPQKNVEDAVKNKIIHEVYTKNGIYYSKAELEKIRDEVNEYKGQINSIEVEKRIHRKAMKLKNIFLFIGILIVLFFILYEWKKCAK